MVRRFALLTLLTAAVLLPARAGLIIAGPELPEDEAGHNGHGLVFKALQNVTLVSFDYHNQGKADQIQLWWVEGGFILHTLNVQGGNPVYAASVNWALEAGQSYYLLGTTTTNGKWAGFMDFPVSNAHISITGSYFSYPFDSYWGDFRNITTEGGEGGGPAVIPEPSSALLLGAGLALAALGRRRRR
jgi:hypothetical protein